MSECSLLELHVSVQVDLGRLGRFMAEPKCDDAEIHAAVEQGHGGRMSKRVRLHLLMNERWT